MIYLSDDEIDELYQVIVAAAAEGCEFESTNALLEYIEMGCEIWVEDDV